MFRWNRIIPVIFFLNILTGQSVLTIDTLLVETNQYQIKLNPFIVDSSFFLFHNGKFVEDYQLNTIAGELRLKETNSTPGIFHASYRYFIQPLPLKIGPIYESLPKLDSLLVIDKDSSNVISINKKSDIQDEISNLVTPYFLS